MQHVRIAFYQLKPEHTADEMVSKVQAEFLPIFCSATILPGHIPVRPNKFITV